MLTRKYQLLLITIVVLAAFYPSFFAGFAPVDDEALEASHRGIRSIDLGNLFVPAHGGGLYYRPLVALSFRIDKLLLGFDPGLMHLENVLMHLLNAFLVYFITQQLIVRAERTGSMLPLMVSLVFALHPVNTESVNWISGRSDLIAGSFLFASMLCLLFYREERQNKYIVLSFALFLGSALTKETSLAFLPGAFLVLGAADGEWPVSKSGSELERERRDHNRLLIAMGVLIALGAFFFFRSAAFISSNSRIGLTIMAIRDDLVHSIFAVLRAFGFYLKKLVFPLPLNFAILEIDPLYEVLAVPLVLTCIYVATRRTALSALFTTSILLITPSFILVFGQIAWTPYAERYLYLASAFFVPAVTIWIAGAVPRRSVQAVRAGAVALLLVLFVVGFHRSLVWQDNMTLIEDTVAKSPEHKQLRTTYAMQLAKKGDLASAKEQLKKASEIPERVYDPRSEYVMAYILYREGDMKGARKILESVVNKTRGKETEAIEYLVSLLEMMRRRGGSGRDLREIDQALFKNYLQIYALNGDPHVLFDLGRSAERLGERKRALRLYEQARDNLMSGDRMRRSAIKRIEALAPGEGAHHAEKTVVVH